MRNDRIRYALASVAFGLSAILSGYADAATASVVTANVNLRAGPSTSYPVVRVLPAGTHVALHGCVVNYAWCDIGYSGARGWVAAPYIQTLYKGKTVVVTPVVATVVGISVVPFSYAYWERYYTAYPWFGHWSNYPAYRSPVPRSGTVIGPYGGTASRSSGCSGYRCGAVGSVNGAGGGTAAGVRGCGPRGCGAAGTLTGPGGRTVSGARGCGFRGCGGAIVGPWGNATVRRRHR